LHIKRPTAIGLSNNIKNINLTKLYTMLTVFTKDQIKVLTDRIKYENSRTLLLKE